MPYRKKKSWINTKRKVNAVINQRLGTHSLVRNGTFNGVANLNEQGISGEHEIFTRPDLAELAEKVFRLQPATQAAVTNAPVNGYKFVVTGWSINTTIRNAGDSVVFIDMYYWYAKRDVPLAEYPNVTSMFTTGFNQQAHNLEPGDPTDFAMTAYRFGTNPFMNPAFKRFLQIYKKVRIRVPVGGTFEIAQRSGRDEYIGGDQFLDQKSLVRGKSKGVFMIYHGPPFEGALTDNSAIEHTVCKNFYFKVLMNNYNSGSIESGPLDL